MKIQCPKCSLTGSVNDATIPVTGLTMNCPRCKTGFLVERPADGVLQAGGMASLCPSCQYSTFSEEMFSVCPKCGLIVADHHRQQAEQRAREEHDRLAEKIRQQDEKSRQKYGVDAPPKAADGEDAVKMSAPLPVQVIGWLVAALAVLLFFYAAKGIIAYLDEISAAEAALRAGDESPAGAALFFRHGLVPILILPYGAAMLVISGQFLRLRLWSIRALVFGAWAGIGLAALHEAVDLVAWMQRASSSASLGYYLVGIGSALLMAALWIIPSLFLINYLRSRDFDRLAGFFN